MTTSSRVQGISDRSEGKQYVSSQTSLKARSDIVVVSKARKRYTGIIFVMAAGAFQFVRCIMKFEWHKPLINFVNEADIGFIPNVVYKRANQSDTRTINNDIDHHELLLDELDKLTRGNDAKDLKCSPPLVPFQNRIVRMEASSNSTLRSRDLIPKTLHFSFNNRCLPEDLAMNLELWKQKLPHYSIFFHDDDAVKRLIDRDWPEFPELHKAMKCVLYKGAMTIDIWRILLIYKYGGVYADVDVKLLADFQESVIRSDLSAFFFSDSFNRPSQWFIAAEPKHPIMNATMLRITENIMNLTSIGVPKLIFVTGPHVLKAAWDDFLEAGTQSYENLYQNNIVYTGSKEKQVLKSRELPFLTNDKTKNGMLDLVQYNSTNVTRKTRISLQSGTVHWKMAPQRAHSKHKIPRLSCEQYLNELESGKIEEIPVFRRTF